MYRTPRYWGLIGLVVFFAVVALGFNEGVFLICAGGLLAWTVVAEGLFRERVTTVATSVTCSSEISSREVGAEQPVTVTTTVTTTPLRFEVQINPGYPTAAAGTPENDRISVEAGETERYVEAELRIPFAGTYEVGGATATVRSAYGLFQETHQVSPGELITVEPQHLADIHVGQGGEEFAVTFGEHGAGTTGPGMDPSGTRAYQPGDPASRINWKATARLDDVYVDEFEVETVRPLLLFLDTRDPAGTTEPEDAVEYRRHIAAALIAKAESYGDPIALYHVTEGGVEASPRLSASPQQYTTVRQRLYRTQQPSNGAGHHPASDYIGSGDRTTAARRLTDDESPFGRTLTPFLTEGPTRRRHAADDPLTRTVTTYVPTGGQAVRVAILAGDAFRSELYEAAQVAGQRSREVLIFTTPTVLFDSQPLGEINEVYAQYTEFERYRQQLDRIDTVTAFEIAPNDTLNAVIKSHSTSPFNE